MHSCPRHSLSFCGESVHFLVFQRGLLAILGNCSTPASTILKAAITHHFPKASYLRSWPPWLHPPGAWRVFTFLLLPKLPLKPMKQSLWGWDPGISIRKAPPRWSQSEYGFESRQTGRKLGSCWLPQTPPPAHPPLGCDGAGHLKSWKQWDLSLEPGSQHGWSFLLGLREDASEVRYCLLKVMPASWQPIHPRSIWTRTTLGVEKNRGRPLYGRFSRSK